MEEGFCCMMRGIRTPFGQEEEINNTLIKKTKKNLNACTSSIVQLTNMH